MNFGTYLLASLVNIFVVFNLAYASASSYRESVTDKAKGKSVNGILLMLFTLATGFGSLVYKVIRGVVNSISGNKSNSNNDLFAGAFDFLAMFGVSFIAYDLFGTYEAASAVDEASKLYILFHIGSYVSYTFISIFYYGFVYGLFGGDNCRIEDTFISNIINKVKDIGDSLCSKDIGGDKDTLKTALNHELDETYHSKFIVTEVIDYLKTFAGKCISTVAEELSTISSIYIGIKNIPSMVMGLLLFCVFSFVFWLGEKNTEVEIAEIINPMGNISDTIKGFIVTMGILVLVKLLARILIGLLPRRIEDAIWNWCYSLNKNCTDKLNNMSKDNLNSDAYAKKYSKFTDGVSHIRLRR